MGALVTKKISVRARGFRFVTCRQGFLPGDVINRDHGCQRSSSPQLAAALLIFGSRQTRNSSQPVADKKMAATQTGALRDSGSKELGCLGSRLPGWFAVDEALIQEATYDEEETA